MKKQCLQKQIEDEDEKNKGITNATNRVEQNTRQDSAQSGTMQWGQASMEVEMDEVEVEAEAPGRELQVAQSWLAAFVASSF